MCRVLAKRVTLPGWGVGPCWRAWGVRGFRLTPGGGGGRGGLPAGDVWEGEQRVGSGREGLPGVHAASAGPVSSGPRISQPPRKAPGVGPNQVQPPRVTGGRSTHPRPAPPHVSQGSPRPPGFRLRLPELGSPRGCSQPVRVWGAVTPWWLRGAAGVLGRDRRAGTGRGPGRTLAPVHPPQCTGEAQANPWSTWAPIPRPLSLCLQGCWEAPGECGAELVGASAGPRRDGRREQV